MVGGRDFLAGKARLGWQGMARHGRVWLEWQVEVRRVLDRHGRQGKVCFGMVSNGPLWLVRLAKAG